MKNRITELLNIKYPIIQGGMVWCSGWRLASAVSNCGGLGLLGAGSMHPEVLREHIHKMKTATDKPWGINIPLLYPEIDLLINMLIEESVKIVFTSAGSPKKYTSLFKSKGITVVHVVSSALFAKKCEEAGVDAVVAEGFEAGGHNGREETTTMTLIPNVVDSVGIPVIAAGGISSGRSVIAAMALGAEGVQIGSRFATSKESSAHDIFKQRVFECVEGDTMLCLKELAPARLIKNDFYNRVRELENKGCSIEDLKNLLGKGRTKKGIFEGDLQEGELEIGQVASMLNKEETVSEIFEDIITEYNTVIEKFSHLNL